MLGSSRKLAACALLVLGAAASSAPSADAATRIGATALEAEAWGSQDCFGATLFVQASSAGASYVVPSRGVITSWSSHGFGAPAPMILKIVRKSSADNYLIRASSEVQTIAPSGTSTFPARIPVAAGDEIALWVPAEFPNKAPCNYVTQNAGDVQAYRGGSHPEPAVGEVFGPTSDHGSKFALNVSAQLEPDADDDGYGDETQDGCSTDASLQAPCPDRIAPETTIAKAPRSKIVITGKRAEVKFAFSSSEVSTFACTLDGETRPCSNPFEARVRKGKHRFSVAATDRAGNSDLTPARARFTVERHRGAERHRSRP